MTALLDAARRALDLLREFRDDYRDGCTIRHGDGSMLVGPVEDDAEHLGNMQDVIDDLAAALDRQQESG